MIAKTAKIVKLVLFEKNVVDRVPVFFVLYNKETKLKGTVREGAMRENLFDRPGEAGAVLITASSFINSLINSLIQ